MCDCKLCQPDKIDVVIITQDNSGGEIIPKWQYQHQR